MNDHYHRTHRAGCLYRDHLSRHVRLGRVLPVPGLSAHGYLAEQLQALLIGQQVQVPSPEWTLGKNGAGGRGGERLVARPYLTRHGLMDKEDVANFPEPLKSRLLVSQCVGWFLVLTLLLEVVAVKAIHYQS
ncbi:hypothetical protein M5C90_16625 [Pseudomonas chlororaphis subsp. piscium]|nr:hypothetical protein M5C90_16625 [Pseudomonas chlororaphis subsp. piscium]